MPPPLQEQACGAGCPPHSLRRADTQLPPDVVWTGTRHAERGGGMAQQPGDAAPTSVSGPQAPSAWVFDAFRVDPREARLWRGDAVLPLHAKAFAVLCCLVTQPGQLVTKDALLEAV